MIYNAARGRVLLFGGSRGPQQNINDLWEWTGTAWEEVTPVSISPSPRMEAAMAYTGSGALLHGGVEFLEGMAFAQQDTFELLSPQLPAAGLSVTLPAGVPTVLINGLVVRAHCGGLAQTAQGAQTGARLLGWSGQGAGQPAGAWVECGSNQAGLGTSAVESALSCDVQGAEARRFIQQAEGTLGFQCRPMVVGAPPMWLWTIWRSGFAIRLSLERS